MKLKVQVIEDHPGEGRFPTFLKGTAVTLAAEDDADFRHWYACNMQGYDTYIPGAFVSDGKLNRDYNPTELVQITGDVLEVTEIVHAWLFATNESGETGWIPAVSVISVV
ncbi:MAG: SH3 domain-containing protein [Oscillospiraceae bacterium]|nr:SH3 domain-containing protein [Oscillospiraceae bacterium]